MRIRTSLAAVAFGVAFAAGCHSAGSPVPLTAQPNSVRLGHRHESVGLVITVERRPSKPAESTGVGPRYISPSTRSVTIDVNGSSQIQIANIGEHQPGCITDGPKELVCTISVEVPEGQDTFEVKLFDEKDGDGNMLADGSKTVDVGSPPDQIEITLDGLVHFIKLSLPANQGPPPCGVNSYALPLTVIAEDADGNEITKPGKYYNPITFTDTDKFGEISFSRKRLTAPGQKVELEYTGGPMNGAAMISAEAKGVHKSDVTPVTFDPKNDWPLANGIVEHWNDQNGNELPFYEEIKSNVKMQRSIAPKIFQMPVVKGPLCEDAYHVSGSGSVAEFYFATRKEGDRYALDFIANGDRAANQFAVQGIFTIDYLPQKAGEHRRFPYPNYQINCNDSISLRRLLDGERLTAIPSAVIKVIPTTISATGSPFAKRCLSRCPSLAMRSRSFRAAAL